MWYEHKKNGNKAELIEKNEKTRNVILRLEDGNLTGPTFSTFQRWWKPIEEIKEAAEETSAEDSTSSEEVVKKNDEAVKEKAEKGSKKATGKVKKEKAPRVKTDISDAYNKVSDVLKKAGYFVKQYDKEPKIIPVSMEADGKKAFCNVYLGAKKCALCIRVAEVPDGYTPSRTRNCPLGAAFDIEYDKVDTIVEILKARKIVKKEKGGK